MHTEPAAASFDTFRAGRSPENLIALLDSCQDRVFELCYQMLGHHQDAEDASQEVLLKIAANVDGLRDAKHFDHWLIRVCTTTSLDAGRRKRARAAAELSPMRGPRDASTYTGDSSHTGICGALQGLDDRTRQLVVRHYIENTPLSRLGGERGCSPVAVWRKLEKARSLMKRALTGIPPSTLPDVLETAVESAHLAPPLPSIGRLMRILRAFGRTVRRLDPTHLINGGAVMTSKNIVVASAFAGALSIAGLVSMSGTRTPVKHETGPSPHDSRMPAPQPLPSAGIASAPDSAIQPASPRPLATLAEFLARFRDRIADGSLTGAELCRERIRLRKLIFGDPDTFLAFLERPENEARFRDLMRILLKDFETPDGAFGISSELSGRIPGRLLQGLRDLLSIGTDVQKAGILGYFVGLENLPEDVLRVVATQLSGGSPTLRMMALNTLYRDSVPVEYLGLISQVLESCDDPGLQAHALSALRHMPGEGASRVLASRLAREEDPGKIDSLLNDITWQLHQGGSGAVDAFADAVCRTLPRVRDNRLFLKTLECVLSLPPAKLLSILDQAAVHAPTPEWKDKLAAVSALVRSGETRYAPLHQALSDPAPAKVPPLKMQAGDGEDN